MADGLGHDLRIKYGLTYDPHGRLIAAWTRRAALLAGDLADTEQAGRRAALEIFGELDAVLYLSQADTIEALLARAKAKIGIEDG